MHGRGALGDRKVVRRAVRHLQEEETLGFEERMRVGAQDVEPVCRRKGCGGWRPSQESDRTTF